MNPKTKNRVLVSPLEWGLGHATRLGRIIELLLQKNMDVVIAADGLPYNFLSEQFPDLPIERLPMKQVKYSKGRQGFFLKLLIQIPGLFFSIQRNKKLLNHLVEKYQIDFIISDNRYGFIHPKVPSVFVTGQLRPLPPKMFRFLHSVFGRLHLWMLRKYEFIWVSDYEGEANITGSLSRIPWGNKKIRYIHPLSWLEDKKPISKDPNSPYDILIMLSGPEPQRSQIEEKILKDFKASPQKILLLQGLPKKSNQIGHDVQIGNLRVVNHLPGDQILWHMQNTKTLICRAGTTTIFDLVVLGKPALLIPTPGQTEQEYIAGRLDKEGYFMSVRQEDFGIHNLEEYQQRKFIKFPTPQKDKFESALAEFIRPRLG